MKIKYSILISFIIVLINGLIGHFFPPFGILLTPVLIIFISLLISFNKKISGILKSLILVFLIILNDVLIKLYCGGRHDSEGLIFLNTF